jgi:putative transposase
MRYGFFYDFSNYGSYECLTDDGLTNWHPAFLRLGNTLFGMREEVQRFLPEVQTQRKDPYQVSLG